MIKRKNLVTIIILGIVVIGLVISGAGCDSKKDNGAETKGDGSIVCDNVKDFKEKSSQGEKCVLRRSGIKGSITQADVIYDGKRFFVDGEEEEKYSHIVELEGRWPNAAMDTYIVVLANEEYTWADYTWIEFKNQAFDSEGNNIYDDYDTEWRDVTKEIIFR